MAFNRSRNDRPGRGGGFRPRFHDRGPVEMHKAICDNCGKECEVPFRPTSGKPIFCSNCFENQRGGSDLRRFERRNSERSEDKQSLRSHDLRPMFDATCADCGDACKVPFQPNGNKPVFCSNCFGDKKNAGDTGGRDKFEEINAKLDRILGLLSPVVPTEEIEKPIEVATRPSSGGKKKTSVKKSPEDIS